jgi:hypothetical protein
MSLAPDVDLLCLFKSDRTLSCVFCFKLSHFQFDFRKIRGINDGKLVLNL